MSIKKKLVTAVTTAGLLAGLFGSAFVPSVRATADDAALAYTAVGADDTASSATYDYWLTTSFPSATISITADDGTDSGSYAVSVSGGTIRSCSLAETTDVDAGASATVIVSTSTQCSSTITLGTADVYTFTIVLNKLLAGAEATISASDDDTDSITITGNQGLTAVAATAGSGALSVSKTAAAIKVDYDGDGTVGETTQDVADTTISGVDYIATSQALGSVAIFGGVLQNAYGVALNVDTTIVATVTAGNYVNCDETPGGGVSNGSVNVVALIVAEANSDFECEVIAADGAEGAGGAWTLTITTVTGTTLDTFSAGFLGEIATVSLAAAYDTIASDFGTAHGITDFWTVSAKDAGGRAYALKDLINADHQETDNLKAYDIADATKAEIAATTAIDADVDGIFDLDDQICDDGDGPTVAGGYETRSVTLQLEDGAGATVSSNAVTLKCGVDVGTALVVDRVTWAASTVAPGGSLKANVYMEDANGFAASPGDTSTADVVLTLTNGTNADVAADGDIELASTTIVVGGYFEVTVVAPLTVGTAMTVYNATSGSVARAYVSSDAYEGALSIGTKKLKATVDFGPAAAKKKIAFVLESASGTTKTFYRKADASGVATYTLTLRGTWTVYATFGDEISDTGTMKK